MTPRSSRTRWSPLPGLAPGLILAVGLSGCATQKYVRNEVGRSEQTTAAKLGEVQPEVERNRESIVRLGEADARHESQLADVSETAREALQRAMEAGKVVPSDDSSAAVVLGLCF